MVVSANSFPETQPPQQMAELVKRNVRVRCTAQNAGEKLVVPGHTESYTTFETVCLTSEYTGLRMTIFRVHRTWGFSSVSNPLLNRRSKNCSRLHLQGCQILICPTETRMIVIRSNRKGSGGKYSNLHMSVAGRSSRVRSLSSVEGRLRGESVGVPWFLFVDSAPTFA